MLTKFQLATMISRSWVINVLKMSFFPCLKLPTVSSGKISQNILASLQKERFNRGKLNAFIMPRKGSTKLDSGGGNLVEKVCKKEKKYKKYMYM